MDENVPDNYSKLFITKDGRPARFFLHTSINLKAQLKLKADIEA